MHRTEGANHNSNLFTDGPPGTKLEQNWLNAVQEEVAYVIEQTGLTLKTAGTETSEQLKAAIDLMLPTLTTLIRPGHIYRSKFEWIDVNTIYMDAGSYDCDGKWAKWDSQLTSLDIGTPTASTWVYLYLDYSAITSGVALTNSEFLWSETAPTWSHTKLGWYNGSDRCIFAVYSDGSSNISEFFHDGDFIVFGDHIAGLDWDIDTSWENIITTLPKFCRKGQVSFESEFVDGATTLYWRVNGQASSIGHLVTYADSNTIHNFNTIIVITDENQTIEVRHDASNGNKVLTFTDGWFFPIGM